MRVTGMNMADATDELQMNEILADLEQAFGAELPFSDGPLADEDLAALGRLFGDDGYQQYLQDQINRQIIRDYLLNARVLGYLDDEHLAVLVHRAMSQEGRAVLALHMVMRSVEEAWDLAGECSSGSLQVLRPVAGSPPQLELIPS